jgi:hypothetical protein
MAVHTYNPDSQEVQAGRSRVGGQPKLHSESLSQKQQQKNSNEKISWGGASAENQTQDLAPTKPVLYH